MKITHFIVWLIILSNTSLHGSDIRLLCKTTKESKEVGNFERVANGENSDKQGKVVSINQFIISSSNFLIHIDSPAHTNTIFDFKKESIITYDYLNHLFSRVPLYYIVHYRISEFQNRNGLAGALEAGGVDAAFGNLFNRESLFGIEDKKDFLKSEIKIKEDKKTNSVKYIYEKNTVVSIEYSAYPIKENYKEMFEKFLIYNFYLHPIIIQDIVNHGYMPENIEYSYINVGIETTVKTEISKFDSDEASLKELTDLSKMSVDTTQRDTLVNMINKIYDTVLKGDFVLIDKQQRINYSEELIQKEKYLDAFLSLLEYLLQSGDNPKEAMQNSISFASKDTNMQTFIRCLQSQLPAEDKITLLESIPQANYDKGYIINIFLANYNSDVDPGKSFGYFQKTLVKNQYITGVYKDLGELYAGNYDMESAWKCYDITLHINEHHSMSKDIGSLKAKLKADFPLYFIHNPQH